MKFGNSSEARPRPGDMTDSSVKGSRWSGRFSSRTRSARRACPRPNQQRRGARRRPDRGRRGEITVTSAAISGRLRGRSA